MFVRFTTRIASIFMLLGLLVPAASLTVEASPTATADDEIIYIDNFGTIRIIDPNVAAGTQEIQWHSPEGGWQDFATGDFNNDGDMEIAAIGNNKLTVFDPVVQSSAITPDGTFNLVPWARLYERALTNNASNRVEAGNMDWNVAADEILIGYPVNEANNIKYRMEVIKTTDGQGRAWATHVNAGFGAPWKFFDVGNINNAGSADVIRLRDENGRGVQAIEIDNNMAEIFYKDLTGGFIYTSAAIGQVYPGGTGEVVTTRTYAGEPGGASVLIFQFTNGKWDTVKDDVMNFFPHPSFVFMADINGNGDDEIFLLRNLGVPSNTTTPRLFMVNRGGDSLPSFSSPLDTDDGYKVGAGGDTDADGRDEVIVMRNNKILQFNAPESGDAAGNRREWSVGTNVNSLAAVNVDGNGVVAGARLELSRDTVAVSLEAGTISNNVIGVKVSNLGSGGNIPITVEREGNANWYQFSTSSESNTQPPNTAPLNIYLTNFRADQLTPGTYTSRLKITSSAGAVNQPIYLNVSLTVAAAKFTISSNFLGFGFSTKNLEPQKRSIAVDGLPNLTYSASLMPKPAYDRAVSVLGDTPKFGYMDEGDVVFSDGFGGEYRVEQSQQAEVSAASISWPSVDWATVESTRNTVPDTITVTVDPTKMTNPYELGILVIVADTRAGDYPNNIQVASVAAVKGTSVYAPFVSR